MTYRSADSVLQSRLEDVEREHEELLERALEAEAACVAEETIGKELSDRLAVSGPGGGTRGPAADRIGVLVRGLCVVGVLLVPAEIYIGGYVHRQPEETVVPILLLAGPGVLAAIIAAPYLRLREYGSGFLFGLALVASAVLNVACGWWFR